MLIALWILPYYNSYWSQRIHFLLLLMNFLLLLLVIGYARWWLLRSLSLPQLKNTSLRWGVDGKRFRPTVASLLQNDVFDDADTTRGVRSPNFIMGKKLCSSRSVSAFSSLCGTCLS